MKHTYGSRLLGEGICKALALVAMLFTMQGCAGVSDMVISGGRVIDPDSGTDQILNVGVRDGRVVQLSEQPIKGRQMIDATGMIVSPGFVDLHSHSHTDEAHQLMVQDGVTTAFAIEVGTADAPAWYRDRSAGSYINYGVGAGHIPARMRVMDDPGNGLPVGPAAWDVATEDQILEILRIIEQNLNDGAVAVGMGIEYTPGASLQELQLVMDLAAAYGASVHVHIGAGIEGLNTTLELARKAGTALQIVHVNSSAKDKIEKYLEVIRSAQQGGQDVTTEAYPYGAGMTRAESAKFEDWKSWPDDEFGKFQSAATGKRLDRDGFRVMREQGGIVIRHERTEDMTRIAITSPLTMIASDGFIENGMGHPRVSGTFAKVLGFYVREQKDLSLMEALGKMTIEPARRLEKRVPQLKRKGRLQIGSDADITIFDPALIRDRSTYENPAVHSVGINYVIVQGTIVVRQGKLLETSRPGRAVRAPVSSSINLVDRN